MSLLAEESTELEPRWCVAAEAETGIEAATAAAAAGVGEVAVTVAVAAVAAAAGVVGPPVALRSQPAHTQLPRHAGHWNPAAICCSG